LLLFVRASNQQLVMEPIALEPILLGLEAFVAMEDDRFAGNSIMGAVPHHQLFRNLILNLDGHMRAHPDSPINEQTGPYYLTAQVELLGPVGGLTRFAPHVFFPYLWDAPRPKSYGSETYAVHHWAKSWHSST